jgi:hypothetical protein
MLGSWFVATFPKNNQVRCHWYLGAASRQLHQFAEMPAPSLADIKLTVAMSGYRHRGIAAFYNEAELLHDHLLTAVVK